MSQQYAPGTRRAVLSAFGGMARPTGLFDVTGPENASESIRLVVYGEAKSAGSKRAFRHPHTDKLIVTETVKGSKSWQQEVKAAAAQVYSGALLDGPLAVTMTFFRVRPRSHYGQGRNATKLKPSSPRFPATRPDVLKLARGVEDALTGVLWTDDSRIVEERLLKEWGEPARLEISVYRL